MENKKDLIKTLAIIILVAVIIGFFTIPKYLDKQYNEAYQVGINDAVINLANQQTQSGNIVIVYNNSLEVVPITTLCQLVGEVQ